MLLGAPASAATTLDDLLNAADMGYNAVVIDGVRRGMDPDSCDEEGLSLLMRAAREGNLELVDFLVRSRANVRARTSWGDSAMSLAAQKGHTGGDPAADRRRRRGQSAGLVGDSLRRDGRAC